MLVVDASGVVDLLIRSPRGARVAERMSDDVVAPELLDVEVLSAVARLVRADEITADRADVAVRRLTTLPVFRVRHQLLVDKAWALRGSLRVADAFYVACAQVLGSSLLTTDTRLGRAMPRGVTVTVVG